MQIFFKRFMIAGLVLVSGFLYGSEDMMNTERLFNEGNFPEVINALHDAQESRSLLRLVQSYLLTYQYREADRLLDPTTPETRFLKALAKWKTGEAEESLHLLAEGGEPPCALLRGVVLLSMGREEEAESEWHLLIKQHPTSDEAQQAKGYCVYLALIRGNASRAQQMAATIDAVPAHWQETWQAILSQLDALQFFVGRKAFIEKRWEEAKAAFLTLAKHHPAEGIYWAARAAEEAEEPLENIQEFRRLLFTDYPDSPYAGEAYFCFYPLHHYFRHEKKAMRHLKQLPRLFPDSPWGIAAYYYIGLERAAARHWNEAIDFFYRAEQKYLDLVQREHISSDSAPYFSSLYRSAQKERIDAHLAMAKESTGTKRSIYLDYAEEIALGRQKEHVEPEISLLLTEIYLLRDQPSQALDELDRLLVSAPSLPLTVRVFEKKGKVFYHQKNYAEALQWLEKALALGEDLLATEETLQLWIDISHCYRHQGETEKAMQFLSQVINHPSLSPLRIEAMYLRAELYALEGRFELAKKQLNAVREKGGLWAKKADERWGEFFVAVEKRSR